MSKIPINVWYYNDPLSQWMQKSTPDFQESVKELKYLNN